MRASAGGPDALLLLLAKLLAVLTGVFAGLLSAYILSFLFITELEELVDTAQTAIKIKQAEIDAFQPELTRADTLYTRLSKQYIADQQSNRALPTLQHEPDEEPQTVPEDAPATPDTPPVDNPADAAVDAAVQAEPEAEQVQLPPELLAARQALEAAESHMRSLRSRLESWERDLRDYERAIFLLNLVSGAVVVIFALLGYLLYPWYYRRLQHSSAQWSALFAQRSLRSGPLLIGFFAGLVLAVLVLLALFTTISMDYGILKLPPFRLAFGAIVTISFGFVGALIGASYFSPPPPPEDPYKDYRRAAAPSLLDSSVLIDGRIYEVAVNGFLQGALVVPKSVLDELHLLSDSGDERKRLKGRRGLDMVNKLKGDSRLDCMVIDDSGFDWVARGADDHLIALAKAMGANVVTNDSNLNRVASARDVRVINLHALANAVKTNHVPGDYLELDITDRGKQRGQGVGYLPDGTMVVVEDGEPHIGKVKTVKLTSISQTQAGRLLFGRVDLAEGGPSAERANGNGGGGC